MITWHPHTDKPALRQCFLIAVNDPGDAEEPHRLEHGIFYISNDGKLLEEKSSVHKAHITEYWWAYERDLLAGIIFKEPPAEDQLSFL